MGRAGLFRTNQNCQPREVLIRVATLPKFARHNNHEANVNFLYRGKALKLG
jgi:hypothetical protein